MNKLLNQLFDEDFRLAAFQYDADVADAVFQHMQILEDFIKKYSALNFNQIDIFRTTALLHSKFVFKRIQSTSDQFYITPLYQQKIYVQDVIF